MLSSLAITVVHAAKMVRPERAFEGRSERTDVYVRRKAAGVHRRRFRSEEHVHAGCLQLGAIAVAVARIRRKIFVDAELKRIDEERDADRRAARRGRAAPVRGVRRAAPPSSGRIQAGAATRRRALGRAQHLRLRPYASYARVTRRIVRPTTNGAPTGKGTSPTTTRPSTLSSVAAAQIDQPKRSQPLRWLAVACRRET